METRHTSRSGREARVAPAEDLRTSTSPGWAYRPEEVEVVPEKDWVLARVLAPACSAAGSAAMVVMAPAFAPFEMHRRIRQRLRQ